MKKPKKISIYTLFDNVNYIIPIYQRNYSWGSLQIEQLIDDINNISDDGQESYFFRQFGGK